MNRELKLAIEQVGREKGIATEVLFEALESALLSASKRTMGSFPFHSSKSCWGT